ncbi:hypothetical protein, partial [Streptomyces spectabilis]|uniref:hypothetical protein n=1 Tax=Streptomyces spectabilis TaxID=68270 RepID=UPI0033D9CDD8
MPAHWEPLPLNANATLPRATPRAAAAARESGERSASALSRSAACRVVLARTGRADLARDEPGAAEQRPGHQP